MPDEKPLIHTKSSHTQQDFSRCDLPEVKAIDLLALAKESTPSSTVQKAKRSKPAARSREFRLPDGAYTSSETVYTRAWRRLARSVERTLDAKVLGFDPTLLVAGKDGGGTFTLPVWAALKMAGQPRP